MIALPLIILFVGGWGVCKLFLPRETSASVIVAYSWLLGSMLISMVLALFGSALSGVPLMAAVTLAAFIPGGLALRKCGWKITLRPPRGVAEWSLCAVLLCECLVLLHFARTTAIDWDGLMVWEIKARIAFFNGGHIPLDYFTDATRSWSHPDYPLLLPMLETWIYLWIGQSNQYLVRILFPFFYLAALLLIYSSVTQASGKRWAGLMVAAMLFFIPFLTVGQVNLFTGYADFPLAVFYLAAVISLIRWMHESDVSHAMLLGIYAAALPWTKHEGTLLWACLMFVACIEFLRRRDARASLRAIAPGMAVIVAWKLFLLMAKVLPNTDFMPMTPANVVHNLYRVHTILADDAFWLGSIDTWSLLWFLFPVALIWIAIRGQRWLALQIAAIVIIPICIYSAVYILSSWASYEAHIDCSMPRLFSHLALVALMALGFTLGNFRPVSQQP